MSSRTRALLNPRAAAPAFAFADRDPSPDLAPFVECHWVARWSLPAPYEQRILACSCVNLVVGTHQPGVHGVTTSCRSVVLEGDGWAVGTRFRPGAFRAFAGELELAALTDRVVTLPDVFGAAGRTLDLAIHAAGAERARLALLEDFLRARRPALDGDALRVGRIVELARAVPELTQAAALASAGGVSIRVLERLFRRYIGVGPKAVLRRLRVQAAVDCASSSDDVDWAALARRCGYFDQAHLIREFKAAVGQTPRRYAARP